MIWIILAVLIFIGLIFVYLKIVSYDYDSKGPTEYIFSILLAFLTSILTFLGILGILFTMSLILNPNDVNNPKVTYSVSESKKIISLKDNLGVEGNHYVYKTSSKYYYMYEDNLGITQNSILVDHSYINFTDNDFKIDTYEGKFNNRFVGYWLGADWLIDKRYKIYIPEDSITTENIYEIDLE